MGMKQKMIAFKALSPCKNADLDVDAQPGDIVEIAEGYARPRMLHNGAPGPSTVAMLCPQLVPVDPSSVTEPIGSGERKEPIAAMPTVEGLVKAGVPEGVAEQLVAAAKAAAKAAAEPPKKSAFAGKPQVAEK